MEQRSDRSNHRERETLPINGGLCRPSVPPRYSSLVQTWLSVMIGHRFVQLRQGIISAQPFDIHAIYEFWYRYYEGWKVRDCNEVTYRKIKLQWQVNDWSVCKFRSFFWCYFTLCNLLVAYSTNNCFFFFF